MIPCSLCLSPMDDASRPCPHCGAPPPEVPALQTFDPRRELQRTLEQQLGTRFALDREIGRGGMGIVFSAMQAAPRRRVAIKVLRPERVSDPEVSRRFTREAASQGQLSHPNILPVYEFGEAGGDERKLAYFVTPFVEGPSLRGLLARNPRLPFDAAVRTLKQLSDALAFAHQRGIIHRDVKPENVLCELETDRVLLTDFGIAKVLGNAETPATWTTDSLGTPSYMAPEQAACSPQIDGRADQYSLGLIAWEMLAGRRAFLSTNLVELVYQHQFEMPPDISAIRPDCPPELASAIQRAIAKSPEARFPDMTALGLAFEAAMRQPRTTRERHPQAPTNRPRHAAGVPGIRAWLFSGAGAAAILLVLVLAGAVGSAIRLSDPSKPNPRRIVTETTWDDSDTAAVAESPRDAIASDGTTRGSKLYSSRSTSDLASEGAKRPARVNAAEQPSTAAHPAGSPEAPARRPAPDVYEKALDDLYRANPGYPRDERSSIDEDDPSRECADLMNLLFRDHTRGRRYDRNLWSREPNCSEGVEASPEALGKLRDLLDAYPNLRLGSGPDPEGRILDDRIILRQEAYFSDGVHTGRLLIRLTLEREADRWRLVQVDASSRGQ